MLKIGSHISAAKGYYAMGVQALEMGANTFAFFTRNPRGGAAKAVDMADIEKFRAFLQAHQFAPIVAHAPYTLNACAAKPEIREFARNTMADDIRRMELIPGNYYNFHPGSHVQQGSEIGIRLIADMLNTIITSEQTTTILLETMAGKGSEVGRNFAELRAILDLVDRPEKMGVCLDTCHVWDGGYDIVHNLDGVLAEFDQVVGLDKLRAVHLNDSMNPLEARKDRHAKIGEGHLGLDAIGRIINHPALRELPFILETPNDVEGYAREIALLKTLYQD